MLSRSSKHLVAISLCLLIGWSLPIQAENLKSTIASAPNAIAQEGSSDNHSVQIASAGCSICGANLDAIALTAVTGKNNKNESALTDSLWGNLILEMAYQRDTDLQKLAKKMNIVSLGTLGAIGAISARYASSRNRCSHRAESTRRTLG